MAHRNRVLQTQNAIRQSTLNMQDHLVTKMQDIAEGNGRAVEEMRMENERLLAEVQRQEGNQDSIMSKDKEEADGRRDAEAELEMDGARSVVNEYLWTVQ